MSCNVGSQSKRSLSQSHAGCLISPEEEGSKSHSSGSRNQGRHIPGDRLGVCKCLWLMPITPIKSDLQRTKKSDLGPFKLCYDENSFKSLCLKYVTGGRGNWAWFYFLNIRNSGFGCCFFTRRLYG
ncbi:hypothetical protein KIL84_021576 [Mauremys mutica]|uniref:Uncharacterized protein n=1 Tax=Mauremys mutica TaxID=74926 RepID=A0A9D3X7Y3_9SAUR|nr:hypothetical protein KIL84_021576 [Mauremys mutica]